MKKQFQNLTEKLRESLIQLVWDQWVSIGAGGNARKAPVPFAVDPEALLLVSTQFFGWEPRLANVCFDWLSLNGNLLHLQRMKNIQRSFAIAEGDELQRVVDFMIENGCLNWKSLIEENRAMVREAPSPTIRNQSAAPDFREASCLIFRLRNFFGMSARAEAFFWMLTHESGHAAAVARETNWLPKTVQLILRDWSDAGICTINEKERKKDYRIDPSAWRSIFLKGEGILWLAQPPFHMGCLKLLKLLEKIETVSDQKAEYRGLLISESFPEIADAYSEAGDNASFVNWRMYGSGNEITEYLLERTSVFESAVISERAFSDTYKF